MRSLRLGIHKWLIYVAIVSCMISAVFSILALRDLNGIVHGQLYNYGLQFSQAWAMPYWRLEDFIYIFQIFSLTFGGSAVIVDVWLGNRQSTEGGSSVKQARQSRQLTREMKRESKTVFCPNCRRNLTKPLTTLGSRNGRSRLIDVCPYCNTVIGDTKENTDVTVAVPRETVKH